ncbi:hypothetical protein COO60DRAFT_1643829 [Scenedesmus sp. NREL 46B-D3]|nr:hypothetical protein COO60DRAFT_1643829 [Scenedesmus sp. NREL 46B-D3]
MACYSLTPSPGCAFTPTPSNCCDVVVGAACCPVDINTMEQARKWCVKTCSDTGCRKSPSQLRREIAEVQSAIEALEDKFDREMPIHTRKKVAELVHACWSSDDILRCPKALDLPEHNSKYTEAFEDSCNKPCRPDKAFNRRRDSARIDCLPAEVVAKFKELHKRAEPMETIHQWADTEATKGLMPEPEPEPAEAAAAEPAAKPFLLIKAGHLEWYSDAFMNCLKVLIEHQSNPRTAPLSTQNMAVCTYEERAQVAEALLLTPSALWNEPIYGGTSGCHHVSFVATRGLPKLKLPDDADVAHFIECRGHAPFSPLGSAESDIRTYVRGRPFDFYVPRDMTLENGYKRSEFDVTTSQAAKEFRAIVDAHTPDACTKVSLSAWADLQCIKVAKPSVCHHDFITLEAGLLEFNSHEFLKLCMRQLGCTNNIPGTRHGHIDQLAATNCFPMHRMGTNPLTAAQMLAYKRYLLSPMCAHDSATVSLLLSSICEDTTNPNHKVTCTVKQEHLHSYPTEFLWLAARNLGALATHTAGRAKLYGLPRSGRKEVLAFEDKLAQAAYSHAKDAAHKKALIRILEARLQLCCKLPCQQPQRACFKITEAHDLNFINMYCEKHQSTMNAHDWGVVAKIKSERMPRLEVCETDLDSLSDGLVHTLVCVLCNSADDAALKRPAMRFFEAAKYSPAFKRGMLHTLAKYPPPAAANAGCCPRPPRPCAAACASP